MTELTEKQNMQKTKLYKEYYEGLIAENELIDQIMKIDKAAHVKKNETIEFIKLVLMPSSLRQKL